MKAKSKEKRMLKDSKNLMPEIERKNLMFLPPEEKKRLIYKDFSLPRIVNRNMYSNSEYERDKNRLQFNPENSPIYLQYKTYLSLAPTEGENKLPKFAFHIPSTIYSLNNGLYILIFHIIKSSLIIKKNFNEKQYFSN